MKISKIYSAKVPSEGMFSALFFSLIKYTLVYMLLIFSSTGYAGWIGGGYERGGSCSQLVPPRATGHSVDIPFGDWSMERCNFDISINSERETNPNVTYSNCRVVEFTTPSGSTLCTGRMWRDEQCSGSQIADENGVCIDFEGVNKGGPQRCELGEGYTGNPINALVGNKYQKEIDYQGDGIFPLVFARDYNSKNGKWVLPLGGIDYIPEEYYTDTVLAGGNPYPITATWQTSDSAIGVQSKSNFRLQRPNYFILRDPRALVRLFIKESSNRYVDKQGSAYANVIESADGFFDGLEVVDENNSVLRYNKDGLLIQNRDLSTGISHDYSYQYNADNTKLVSVTIVRSAGGSLQANFNLDGKLNNVVTPDQESIVYGYDNLGRLILISYPNQSLPRLYHYEDLNFPNALTGITDENGVRFATWAYDTQGRAISSEHHSGAEKVVIDYANIDDAVDPRVLITNELGKQTTFHIASYLGKKKIVSVEGHQSANCAAANKNYTYFPNGQVQTKTDWEGNTTSYEYNSRNLEISRTEAIGTPQGRTITTEWHPTFNLRTKITEPGRETVFAYDAEGRLTSQVTNNLPLN